MTTPRRPANLIGACQTPSNTNAGVSAAVASLLLGAILAGLHQLAGGRVEEQPAGVVAGAAAKV